jgi:hypothetical protein
LIGYDAGHKEYDSGSIRIAVPIDKSTLWPIPEAFLPEADWSQLVRKTITYRREEGRRRNSCNDMYVF